MSRLFTLPVAARRSEVPRRAAALKTGIIGTFVTALCCFTPLLVVILGGVGLSAWLVWMDYVLFPMLGGFLAMTGYGLWKWRSKNAST